MIKISEHTENDILITKYSRDGKTVSHIIKSPLQTEQVEEIIEKLSIQEQILYETQYQTIILEMGGM